MKPSSDIALLTTTLPFPVSLTVTSKSAVGGREGLEPHNLRIKVRSFAAALKGHSRTLAQATLFEALDRGRVSVVAPIVGTGVLWTVVFAAIFLGRGELVGRRLFVVALLVVAGSTLVGATR